VLWHRESPLTGLDEKSEEVKTRAVVSRDVSRSQDAKFFEDCHKGLKFRLGT